MDYQRLLLDHLDPINQIVQTVGRRRHLSATDRQDFASFVHLRLVDDHYAILRKFQNRSSLWTYLAAVIERLSLDFCDAKWGRWRPSKRAERVGPVAVELERLVYRESHTIEEAVEILRTNHDVGLTDTALREIWARLPPRIRATEVGEEEALEEIAPQNAETTIDEADRRRLIGQLQQTLSAAFEQIPAKDRVLIALRFDQDLSVVEIAKLTGSSEPTVHRRLDKSVKQLRLALSHAGLDPREIVSLLGHPSMALSPLLRAEIERFLGHVRLSKRDG